MCLTVCVFFNKYVFASWNWECVSVWRVHRCVRACVSEWGKKSRWDERENKGESVGKKLPRWNTWGRPVNYVSMQQVCRWKRSTFVLHTVCKVKGNQVKRTNWVILTRGQVEKTSQVRRYRWGQVRRNWTWVRLNIEWNIWVQGTGRREPEGMRARHDEEGDEGGLTRTAGGGKGTVCDK